MKLSATHTFNCIVLMVKFGRTSCEDIPPALLMIGGLYKCNCLVYGPQVCSWVLHCHIGPHLDVWQVASRGILLLYDDLALLWFLPRPVAKPFLCFTPTQE